MKKSKKWFLIFTTAILIFFVMICVQVYRNVNWEPNEEAVFVHRCRQLDGKAFTYENLIKLNGYVGLSGIQSAESNVVSMGNGFHSFEKIYFDKYLKGIYRTNDGGRDSFTDEKLILVMAPDGTFAIASNQGVEMNWRCYIKPDLKDMTMTTKSEVYYNE